MIATRFRAEMRPNRYSVSDALPFNLTHSFEIDCTLPPIEKLGDKGSCNLSSSQALPRTSLSISDPVPTLASTLNDLQESCSNNVSALIWEALVRVTGNSPPEP